MTMAMLAMKLALFLILLSAIMTSALWTYRVRWPEGKVTTYTYPRTAHGDCLYDRQRDLLICMRNHGYQRVVNTWLYDPELITYVSLRCQAPHPYPHHLSPLAPTCLCRDHDHTSSTDSMITSDPLSSYLYRCQLQELSPSALEDLDELEVLDLSHNLLRHLSRLALLPLSSLKVLSLASNPLRSLPEGVVCPLTSLEVLDLSQMQLTSFPGQAFRCDGNDSVTSPVRWLDISGNHIGEMAAGSLWYLSGLTFLNLSDNLLHHLPNYPLLGAPSLTALSLRKNLLLEVPQFFCEGAPRLQRLSLQANVFSSLQLSLLDTCQNLTHLDLTHNVLSSLPGPPASLPRLQYLRLSHNRLKSLTSPIINDTCSLLSVDLSHNALRHVSHSAFTTMTKLVHLDLHDNALNESTMDLAQAFLNLTKLQTLNLSRNQFSLVTDACFTGLVSLMTLDLSQNNIQRLSFAPNTDLTRLIQLNVSFNQLSTLSVHVLSPLVSLRVLDLSHNLLHRVAALNVPGTLLNLNMADNVLQTVPILPGARNLQHLDLSFNSVTRLGQGDLRGLSALTSLDLGHNSLGTIHVKALVPVHKVQSLQLAYNHLVINGTVSALLFSGLRYLQALNLSHNRLSDVKALFQADSLASLLDLDVSYNAMGSLSERINQMNGTMHLEHLYLRGCRLRQISANAFSDLIYLRSVDLRDNKLTYLPLFRTHPGVRYRLAGNPVTCDCRMGWLKEDVVHVQGQAVPTHDYDVTSCRTLPRGHLLPVRDVAARDFLCVVSSALCPPGCVCYSATDNGSPTVVFCTGGVDTLPTAIPVTTRVLSVEGGWLGHVEGFGQEKKEDENEEENGEKESWPFMLEELYLNNSGVTGFSSTAFSRLPFLTRLQLDHNQLSDLPSELFHPLHNLTSLFLHSNRLLQVPMDLLSSVKGLQELDLSDNSLTELPAEVVKELSDSQFLICLRLSDNPWKCGCENVHLYDWMKSNVSVVSDYDSMYCQDKPDRWFVTEDPTLFHCSDSGDLPSSVVALLLVGLPAMVAIVVAVYKFRRAMAAVGYSRLGIQCLKPQAQHLPLGRLYDVSVLCDHSDRKCRWWVDQILLPRLTSSTWRLRVHVPRAAGQTVVEGSNVVDSAVYSVRQSAMSLVLVSKHFGAHQHTVTCLAQVLQQAQSRPHSLVLVTWGELTKQTLECGIRPFLGKRQHLPITVPFFWDRLLYLLPSPRPTQSSRRHSLISACRFRSLSDVSSPSDDKTEAQSTDVTQQVSVLDV